MNIRKIFLNVCIFLMLSTSTVFAKTQIEWWHAFGGRLGELLDEQVQKFNASQNDYEVLHTRKGNYSETLNAGIAAFRAKQQPHLLMVFEVGTATMMAAKGAIKPVYEVMLSLVCHSMLTLTFHLLKVITQQQMERCYRYHITLQLLFCG